MMVSSPRRASSVRQIAASVSGSSALVASSRISTRGLCASARASTTRWRWPPDSLPPRSPTIVSVALRQRRDDVPQACRAQRGFGIGRGQLRIAQRHVVAHRVVQQDRLLRHVADHAAPRAPVDARERQVVDPDFALLRPQQRRDEVDHRRLAGARRADDRRDAARGNREGRIAQDPRVPIPEAHVLEADRLPQHGRRRPAADSRSRSWRPRSPPASTSTRSRS